MTEVRFGVLGPIAGWRGTEEIGFGAAKRSRVLAALLLHAGRRVDRETIIDVVWGGDPPRSGVNLVQKYVGDLRRVLRRLGSGDIVESAGHCYRLRLAPEQLDSWVFGRHLEQARAARAAGEPALAGKALDAALGLWRGPAFGGLDAGPVVVERARLEESRLAAVEELLEIRLLLGEHASVLPELSRLSREHPLREHLRELRMLALYRAGRQAEALAVFDDTRRLLADELGVDPGPALRALHERILRADSALDATPGRAAAAPGGPAGAEGGEPPARQLPRDVPDFTGRADALATLARLLADPGHPPVVVVGAPGVGKSALAVRAAHAAAGLFPDGALYLNLAGTSTEPRPPSAMLAELLRAIGVRGAAIPEGLDERAALYRSHLAERRTLLLLDDAADATQVRPLLPGTAHCAVLVTSRHRLTDLAGARGLELGVFRPDEARELLARVAGANRVEDEPDQADAIARFCGYLPLAIRVGAAKLAGRPGWSLRVLRDRLADQSRRIGELRVGDTSVRASFEVSVRMLSDRAARAFRSLGLLGAQTFPGWVIGPLLGERNADDALDELLDASLLTVVGTDAVGQARYRLHDLLRDYAVKAADADPPEARARAVARVLGAWLHLAEKANEGLPRSVLGAGRGSALRVPPGRETERPLLPCPLAWFDTERIPLLGAVALAADWGLDELAWELATAVVPYYDHRGNHDDWQRGHEVALRAVVTAGNRRGEAALLRGLGQVRIYREDFGAATRTLRRSRRLFHACGDERGEATALAGLATAFRLTGRFDDALGHAVAALDLLAGRDRPVEAQIRNGVGMIRLAQGRDDEAGAWFTEALRLARETGDRHREAAVLRDRSGLHVRRGDATAALADLHRALAAFEGMHDERCVAFTLLALGEVYADTGDGSRAAASVERAMTVFRKAGSDTEVAAGRRLLGRLGTASAALPAR
ncbi:DNA-binding SARP family transcriptional activator [Prauserella shujinwangii]|uniref:DNA-binding SARP family transcriptional activator n=1 Tax=Prauserella shujinwangii TaxID=1453103 RepID=A0A2T0M2I4_9PSEU|nr:BTAD domain-containing putative transcriptional regulator [Prauserella shujinwangii]PRX50932.1 DNA-binding SARP family transcriptional activator [Prauserella shujinwangii]